MSHVWLLSKVAVRVGIRGTRLLTRARFVSQPDSVDLA